MNNPIHPHSRSYPSNSPPSSPTHKKRNSSEIELSSSNNYPSFGTLSSNKQFHQPYNPIMKEEGNDIYTSSKPTTKNNQMEKQKKQQSQQYQGWKLSIPAPSYYNHDEYDSFHIEFYSSSKDDNSNNKDNQNGPFVKLPKRVSAIKPTGTTLATTTAAGSGAAKMIAKGTIKPISSSTRTTGTLASFSSDDDDYDYFDNHFVNDNKKLLSSSTSPKKHLSTTKFKATKQTSLPPPLQPSAAAWTYSAPSLTHWKISSQSLLSITYKKSIHCLPSYTNRNICIDYINRLRNCATSCSKSNGGGGNCSSSNGKDSMTPIFQEVYTEQDIIHVEMFPNVNIMGFTGSCKAIQIHFERPINTNHNNYKNGRTITTTTTTAAASHDKKHRFDINPTRYNTNGCNSKQEEKLKMKLSSQLHQSEDHTRQVPFDGENLLKDHEYGIENDYGLPLPPWDPRCGNSSSRSSNRSRLSDGGFTSRKKKRHCHDNNNKKRNDYDAFYDMDVGENEDDDDDDKSSIIYGPILTFAIPNLSDENQIDFTLSSSSSPSSTSMKNVIQDAAPLLWKVEFPPDPSIAIEAFTVLDGVLDVHPSDDDDNNNDGVDNEDDDSCSSCSKDDCDACHPTNIYINGYQSWSFAGSVRQGEIQPTSAMPDFLSKAFNYGADVPPVANVRLNSSSNSRSSLMNNSNGGITSMRASKRNCNQSLRLDNYDEDYFPFHEATFYKSDFYTCVSSVDIETSHHVVRDGKNDSVRSLFNQNSETKLDEMGGTALVLGFLSQRKQFGLITFDSELERVAMHASLQGVIASKSGGISTDWAYCQILPSHVYDEEPMVYYLTAVSSYNNAKPLSTHPPLTGWCSWYHYYENIDLVTLNANFHKMSGLKETITQDLAIVDDGYITAWGDWASLKPKEFPEEAGGMKDVADNIRMNNMIPGLWMAPFAVDKHSQVAKDHPDWIIKNNEGRIANSANCGKFFYGLDATNPAVREFAFNSVRRAVQEWGYKCLKLDFLYAACLDGNGKYDLSMSRAETMYLALKTLRAAAGPDTFLIGCGCPLGPAVGYMDSMRISADTGPTWYPDFPLPWWDNATLPSLRAMIRNSTTRACLGHRWWHNDPDCVLLGETTSLSDNEVISAASIVAMTGKKNTMLF